MFLIPHTKNNFFCLGLFLFMSFSMNSACLSDKIRATDFGECTMSNQCGVGEGDCDSDEECSGALICGNNNCFTDGSEISAAADCCYDPPTSTTTTIIVTTATGTSTNQSSNKSVMG